MKATSLLYHDVIDKGLFPLSGFPGPGASHYKLEREQFQRHLQAIAQTIKEKPISVLDLSERKSTSSPFILTFDDGGASACTIIADLLENYGWRGHFLITTNYIGTKTFISKGQIRDLRRQGHIIGSHSCSHPKRMASCSWEELLQEWHTSINTLSDILSEPVSVASVPGGYYSRRVAMAASLSGIKALFTSEPKTSCYYVDRCLVLGRYTILRSTSSQVVADLAANKIPPRLMQFLFWNSKKVAKFLGGRFYPTIRKYLLAKAGENA